MMKEIEAAIRKIVREEIKKTFSAEDVIDQPILAGADDIVSAKNKYQFHEMIDILRKDYGFTVRKIGHQSGIHPNSIPGFVRKSKKGIGFGGSKAPEKISKLFADVTSRKSPIAAEIASFL